MDNFIALAASAFYLLAIANIVPALAHQTGIKVKTVFTCAMLALVFHAWLMFDLIFAGSVNNLSILNVASLMSFIISFAMSSSMLKNRLWFMLPIVYAFAVVNLLAANFTPVTVGKHLQDDAKLLMHIGLALTSYCILIVAALYSIQLAWLDHKLKCKKALAINPNLPPLMLVERQLFKILIAGTVLLTGTLLTGYLFVQGIYAEENAHKAILSFVAWLVYLTLLWGHYQRGWRGRLVTWFCVSGSAILTLGYFGSRFVSEVILR